MLAARFHAPDRPLILEETTAPRPGHGQVVVDVRACGLCGSDVHIVKGETFTAFRPITLGHEAAGVVAETGSGVDDRQTGDRVAVNCVQTCGVCRHCRSGREAICENRRLIGIHLDGGLAPRVAVNASSLIALPDEVPFETGAIITDAVATPYHALKARAELTSGQSAAIFGVGGLGAHAVMLARLMGAGQVIAVDPSPAALARARKMGADEEIDPSRTDAAAAIREMTNGRGVDVALECVGAAATVSQALAATATGGRTVIVGLSPQSLDLGEITPFVRSEVAVMGSSAFTTGEIAELVDLAAGGRLDLSASVTDTLPLTEVNQGLRRLMDGREAIIRLVVNDFSAA